MRLVARLMMAVALVLVSALSWAQISYFTLIDSDNNAATGCAVTLPTAGSVPGIERRLTATVSENAAPQVTQLSLESCVGSSFGAAVALPGTPYPVGLNNGVGGADVVEQAVLANDIAPRGRPCACTSPRKGGPAMTCWGRRVLRSCSISGPPESRWVFRRCRNGVCWD